MTGPSLSALSQALQVRVRELELEINARQQERQDILSALTAMLPIEAQLKELEHLIATKSAPSLPARKDR
jgi:hypothetical protein